MTRVAVVTAMNFWRRLRNGMFGRTKTVQLVCMRYADMYVVHPQQIIRTCNRCGETVGVYPSGQQVLETHRGNVEIVCNHCSPGLGPPAPGALDEVGQSQPKIKPPPKAEM